MTYAIASNVAPPIPPAGKYPLDALEVGDSFFVPDKLPSRLSGAVRSAADRTGFVYCCRSRVKRGVIGTRVWRLK